MAERVTLTDRKLRSQDIVKAERYDLMDSLVPGFGVRISPKGKRTFILIGRFGGSKFPTRRSLGTYGAALTLEQARDKARKWIGLNQGGTDPKVEQERTRRAALLKQKTSFASVAEEFIKRHVAKQRTAKAAEREIRKELIDRWGARPITDITRGDVINLIEEIADRPAPYYAHLILCYVRSMFNWAIARNIFGLEMSPCDRLNPAKLIGSKEPRQRVLTDAEIAALWHAAETLGYPFGPLYRVLMLTGARKSEISEATWSEVDLDKKLLTIPPDRFKSNASHTIPLTQDVMAILEALPRFSGDYIFSATLGSTPVSAFSQAKRRIDASVAAELGDVAPWVTHDIRRTVRTRLASLRVSDIVAEMVIGHGRRGIQRVYDQHSYEPEMREALALWAAKLRSIVTPPPENVTEFKKRA